jgi:hypothetical protein
VIDAFKQGRKVWRYVVVKQSGSILDIIAVLAAATVSIYAGAAILGVRFILGLLTDLTFFSALTHTTNGGTK